MPISFRTPTSFEHVPVLAFKVDSPIHFQAGHDAGYYRETDLHWLPDAKRSAPCFGLGCPYCPARAVKVVFLPVLAWRSGCRGWSKAVLPINQSARPLLETAFAAQSWVGERKKWKNAPIFFTHSTVVYTGAPFAGFDVVPHLLNAWGCYSKKPLKEKVA